MIIIDEYKFLIDILGLKPHTIEMFIETSHRHLDIKCMQYFIEIKPIEFSVKTDMHKQY